MPLLVENKALIYTINNPDGSVLILTPEVIENITDADKLLEIRLKINIRESPEAMQIYLLACARTSQIINNSSEELATFLKTVNDLRTK